MTTEAITAPNRWLAPAMVPEGRFTLFCFAHAGGGAGAFRTWQRHMPSGFVVRPVKLPGREDRFDEEPATDLDTLADQVSEALVPLLDRPFGFFGHSMGGLLAFAVTQRLTAAGYEPSHFFVSSCRAPHLREAQPILSTLATRDLQLELIAMAGTEAEVLADESLMLAIEPTIRADLGMCESYQAEAVPTLPCPISAFGGDADNVTPTDSVREWAAHTGHGFKIRIFPGGHFYLAEHEPALVGELVNDLRRVGLR